MVALAAGMLAALACLAAEWLHAWRVERVARLAFGPSGKPASWARLAPLARTAAIGALCWGLAMLWLLPPRAHRGGEVPENERRQLLLVLDVSPSMRLADAGPTGKQQRAQRAADLLASFFARIPLDRYRTSIVATYTEAKPVVVGTSDLEVVRNILHDLPMQYAFPAGSTDLLSGIREAARMAQPWNPRSTTLVLLSDGDTVAPTGMPTLPASIDRMLVVGVGDPVAGQFIDGHMSRQDVSTLRQMAVRLRGKYFNGNAKHLPSDLVRTIALGEGVGLDERLTLREYALLAAFVGATVLAVLPWLLTTFGTRWSPGVKAGVIRTPSRQLARVV